MFCCAKPKPKSNAEAADANAAPPQLADPIDGQCIGVFGGLGRQGGSVIAELVKWRPDVSVKAFTRGDVNSEDAKKLKATSDKVGLCRQRYFLWGGSLSMSGVSAARLFRGAAGRS